MERNRKEDSNLSRGHLRAEPYFMTERMRGDLMTLTRWIGNVFVLKRVESEQ